MPKSLPNSFSKKKKTCETCLHKILQLNLSDPKNSGLKCDNYQSERYEGAISPEDSCDKWQDKFPQKHKEH